MLRTLIFLLFVALLPLLATAQQPTTIKGTIYDSTAKKALSYASVSLIDAQDSTLAGFTKADSSGKFLLKHVSPGVYLLSVSYVGYKPLGKKLQVKNESLDLGDLILKDIANLDEVTVTAKRSPVVVNGDTLEFNTENFTTQPNAVVEDLLKKLPGVVVEADGTIKVNGQTVNKVFVNGKEFFSSDPKMATKNLNADAIDKVQVFDKKSDRSEFTGIDDGNSQKAINLKLKPDRNHALFGKATAGASTEGKYDAQANINRFNGDQQLSFIGMANNTNRQGFGINDVMNFTGELSRAMRNGGGVTISVGGNNATGGGLPISGQNQQGVATTYAGGINYNDNWNKKSDVNGSFVTSDMNLFTNKDISRKYLLPGSSYNYLSTGNGTNDTRQQRVNLSIDQKIDSLNSIKIVPVITFQQQWNNNSSSYNSAAPDNTKLNDGINSTFLHNDGVNMTNNMLYKKRFLKKGRTFSANINMNYNHSQQDGSQYSKNTFYTNGVMPVDSTLDQNNSIDAETKNIGTTLTYTEPVAKYSLLELTTFYSVTAGSSNKKTYDYNGATGKHDLTDALLSNDYSSNYSYSGGTINLLTNKKNYNLTIGGSLQAAILKSTNNSIQQTIRQSFTDVLPAATFQYKFSQWRNLRIVYNTYTQQPSTAQLQPVPVITDPLNITQGNPDLKRSYTQSATLTYFSANLAKKSNLFLVGIFNTTSNSIVNADVIQTNGARVSTPVNANGVYSSLSNANYGFSIKKLKSRIDAGIIVNLTHNIGFINGDENKIDNTSVGPSLRWNYTIDNKIDISALGRLSISKAIYSLQPELNTHYQQQQYGLDMTNYLPWGLVVYNNFTYTINTGRADGYNTKVPAWNASIAKSFLKNKRAEFKLSVFDLLNQNIGTSRNANQNYIEDIRYNVLQRYFLLSFTFNINKAGAKAPGPQVMISQIGG